MLLTDTAPLLVRPAILEGEMLVSFLFRLSSANHYVPPNLLIRYCFEKNRPSEIAGKCVALIQEPEVFDRLSRITGTPQGRLYDASAHIFAELITPPDVQTDMITLSTRRRVPLLGPGIAGKQLRSEYASQYCPICLETQAYIPTIWMPVAVSSCIHHKCILVVDCGNCGKGIGALEVVQRTCKRCGHDLRNTPTISIKDDEWGLSSQKIIHCWLSASRQPTGHKSLQLPDQSVRVLYRLSDGIRQVLQSRPSMDLLHTIPSAEGNIPMRSHLTRRRLSPAESYTLYSTAMKAMTNWPSGFHDFLEAFGGHLGEASTSIIKQRFGTLHSNWLQGKWAHPHFRFVQEAYDQYLQNKPIAANSLVQLDRYRHQRKPHESYRYVSLSEAAHMLKTGTAAVRKLVAAGHLENVPPKDTNDTNGSTLLLRDEVMNLSRKWNSAISLSMAMDILGLNRAITLDLARAGTVRIVRGPNIDGSRIWRLDRKSVEDYLNTILPLARSTPHPGEMVNLTGAVHITANVGLKAVGLLCRVSQGHLPAYRANSKGYSRLKDLAFLRTDIIRLCQEIVKENGWVRKKEILNLLQISAQTLDNLIRSGSLRPSSICNNIAYFDITVIRELQTNAVSITEDCSNKEQDGRQGPGFNVS